MDKSPEQIEETVEAKPIGLPLALQALNRQQMAEWVIALRVKPVAVDSAPEVSQDEQPT